MLSVREWMTSALSFFGCRARLAQISASRIGRGSSIGLRAAISFRSAPSETTMKVACGCRLPEVYPERIDGPRAGRHRDVLGAGQTLRRIDRQRVAVE